LTTPTEETEVEMAYDGPDDFPFHIRGKESGKTYRVRKGHNFPVLAKDVGFFSQLPGFKVIG